MEKKKIVLMTIVIFVVGLIITGASYAFWSWNSTINKNVVFNTANNLKNYIVYNEGESAFTGELNVSNNYQTGGIHSTISIYKTTNVNLLATIHMDINQIGENMKNSPALKWVVTEGTTSNVGAVLAKGNFIGTKSGDVLTLVPDINVTTTETFYTIWIWLDSSANPSDNLSGETLDTNVWTEINQVEGSEDRYEITNTTANYQAISATVVDSKYKVTHYAVTTTNSEPTSWTTITPETDQSKVYNLNTTVNNTGTYYIWFKDESGRTKSKEVKVTTVDTSKPSCTWGAFTPVKIANGITSTVTLTCTDNESGISVHNLQATDFTPSNNRITISNITKESVTNGYKYTITVTGTANDGTSHLSLTENKVKNGINLGNDSTSSGDVTVENIISVSDAVVTLEYTSTTYNGSAKTPSVTVTKNGTTLTKDTDYTVTYTNNTNVGTATVTITGINNYGGETTKTFTISYNSFNITLDNANATTNGTSTIYMRYADGVYLNNTYTTKMTTSANPIATLPQRTGYTFAGYYDGSTQMIDATGKITSAFTNTKYSAAKTLNAHWTAKTYTVDFDENLFVGSSKTESGVTITYDQSNQYITLNGTQTAKLIKFGRLYDRTVSVGDVYRIKLEYVSGSYTSSTSSNTLVMYFQKNETDYDWNNGVTYKLVNLPTSGSTTQTIEVTSTVADANNLLFALHNNTANSTTYNNYKFRVLITKVETKSVTYNNTYGALPTPTKAGYTFNGWYTAVSGGTQVTSSTIVSTTSSHTLYAHWTPKTYTVDFDDNRFDTYNMTKNGLTITYDGSNHELTINGTQSATITLQNELHNFIEGDEYKATLTYVSGTVSSSDGSNYLLCNDIRNQDASSIQMQYCLKPPATSVNTVTKTITADAATNGKILYTMLWVASSNKVTYTNYKMKVDFTKVESKSVTYNSAYGTLPAPTRTGYTFNGWYTAESGGTQVTTSSPVTTASNHTLYAHWTPKTYTVDFDDNRFDTYNMTKNGLTITYNSSNHELTINGTQSATITLQNELHNFIEGDEYKATLTYVSGTVSSSDGSNYLLCNDIRNQDASSIQMQYCLKPPATSVNTVTKTITADAATNGKILYTMLWVASSNKVTYTNYKMKVDFTKVESKSVTYNSAYGTLPAPTRTGYTFNGWYTAESGGTQVTSSSPVTTSSNHTLYAHWVDATPPTVSYSVSGGSYNTAKTITITANDIGGSNLAYMSVHVYNSAYGEYANFSYDKSISNSTSNTFSVNLDTGGQWTIYTYAVDNAGNIMNQSPTDVNGWYYQQYNIDYTAPTASYSVAGGSYNTAKNITITGSDTGGSGFKQISIRVYQGAANDYSNEITSKAIWNSPNSSHTISLDSPGTYTVYTQVMDNANNLITQTPNNGGNWYYQTYIIDTTPPTVSYSVSGGTYNTAKSITITGSDTGGSGFKQISIRVYQGAAGDYSNEITSKAIWNSPNSSHTISLDDNGTYTVYAQVMDNANNLITQTPNNGGNWYYQQYTISKVYTLTYDDNRFNTYNSGLTINGVSVTYAASTHQLTLNGTQSGSVYFQHPTHTFTEGDKYKITLTYISGSLTSTSRQVLCLQLMKKGNASMPSLRQTCPALPTSSNTTTSGTLTISADDASTANVLFDYLWYDSSGTVSYSNYVVKVDITKVDSKSVTYNSTYGTLPTPTRIGYTFNGWYTAESGGTQVTSSTTVTTSSDYTLYAHWTKNTYLISYVLNGGTHGETHPDSATYDTRVALSNPTKTVTVTGNANSTGASVGSAKSATQTFAGWTSNANTNTARYGTDNYYIASAWSDTSTKLKNNYYMDLTTTNNASVTMTANWTPVAVTLPTLSKTGNTCNYYTASGTSGGSLMGTGGASWTPGATSNAAVTAYARCSANQYTITYNANGGSGAPSATTYTYAPTGTTNLSSTKPTRSGYSFLGWSTSSTATSASYSAGQAWGLHNANNYILYAVWGQQVTCSGGTYVKSGELTCTTCPAGSSCPGGTFVVNTTSDQGITQCSAGKYAVVGSSSCTTCVAGSYSAAGAGSCTACAGGKTSSAGASSCSANCSNSSNVSSWYTPTWSANSMTNMCRAKSCASGYRISGSSCILDTKCYSARFGSKCYSSASIYSSTQLEGLRTENKIKGYQYDSTWLRVTGYTSVGGSTYNSISCYMQYSNLNLIGNC